MEHAEPVAILCGGRGTRLQEKTHAIPKPLVEIGGRPIAWHVVRIYAAHGFRRFHLLTGYRSEMMADFAASAEWPEGVEVSCLETGLETPTGGRVALAAERIPGLAEGTFALTYADGVSDVDLGAALDFHRAQVEAGRAATVTLVQPHSQWGVALVDEGGAVGGFIEKPRMEQWINGGFFFLEPGALAYLDEGSVLEREPLEGLAGDGRLAGYRHTGFWECMDTYKDAVQLNDMWSSGEAPWQIWEEAALR